MPFFSVIIATRNRPALFGQALKSVLAQSWSEFEVIVVNDNSALEHQAEYATILDAARSAHVRSFLLTTRPEGHGGSYVRNFGASKARSPYLCFLDDDDYWTDSEHLKRAQAVIASAGSFVDLYLANQVAFLRDEQQAGPLWLGDLRSMLDRLGKHPDCHGAYTLTTHELLLSAGFCHLNTLIVRRGLYEEVGGMEESVLWEHDRDLYLRLIDRATNTIKYVPMDIARHNIPDPAAATSITTSLSHLERLMDQLMVLNRALGLAHHSGIRAYARRHKAYTLKRIAEALSAAGRHIEAARYAREALRVGPTFKWAGYTAFLTLRASSRRLL